MSSTTDGHPPALAIASGPPLASEPGLGPLTLPGFLHEVTSRYPEREALVADNGGEVIRWSYAQLWERAHQIARSLRACGLGKDGRVGILMTNRPEWIAAVFGTSMAGGVAVTLSTFSTPAELDHLLELSGVSVLLLERTVASKDFVDTLIALEPAIAEQHTGTLRSTRYPFLRHLAAVDDTVAGSAVWSWPQFLAMGRDEPADLVTASAASVQPSDSAVLFFSSGSTSKPKGICSAHRGVTIQMWRFSRMFGFTPDDYVRCWAANGFFWSGNFGQALGATLAAGGALVLQPMFDAAEALALIEREKVNFPVAWPHQWAQLESAPNWRDTDLSSLRFADKNTPAAQHPTVSTTWSQPNHAYGNTETFTITTCFPGATDPEVSAGSSGEPLPGVTVKITDPLSGTIVDRGQSGEICVKGPTLMLGYVGTPLDETLDSDGFFHTGDGGRLDQCDRLYWEGRLTDIIKTGGANVSPLEVDDVLAGYSGIKVARTVGVPHETLGELVVACVIPYRETNLVAEDIRAFAKERLASYKVPRHVLFFHDDDIALTGSAKIKSSDLRRLAAERLAVANQPDS